MTMILNFGDVNVKLEISVVSANPGGKTREEDEGKMESV